MERLSAHLKDLTETKMYVINNERGRRDEWT